MASEGGETGHPLIRALEEDPASFTFFQAIRLLEQAYPETVPVGESGPASREVVRLRPTSSLAFPTSDLTAVTRRRSGEPPIEIETPIFGLYGPSSPLPAFYSEDILKRELLGESDPVRVFLDVLNHRLLALLFRAWSKYRWEFTFKPGATDRTSAASPGAARARDRGPAANEWAFLPGACSATPDLSRSAHAARCSLAGVISDYFDDVPADVEQCVLRRVEIPVEDQNRIGIANGTLGEDLVIGKSVPDRTGKCRIRLGPMDRARYEQFLPGGRSYSDARRARAVPAFRPPRLRPAPRVKRK